MRTGLALVLLAMATPSLAANPAPAEPNEVEARAPAKKACLTAAETREEIKAHALREPFEALKSAAQHFKAEALSAKLCRIDDEFVYEIALLHRDGRYFHAHVNATTGRLIDYKRPPAAPKT